MNQQPDKWIVPMNNPPLVTHVPAKHGCDKFKDVQVNSASSVNIFRSYADVVTKSTQVSEVEGEVDPSFQ